MGSDPLQVQFEAVVLSQLEGIRAQLNGLVLLQQQLAVLERQMDSLTVLASRGFTATLSPEARAEERRQAHELAQKIAKDKEDEMHQMIAMRSARGVPEDGDAVTQDDLDQAMDESMLQ